ncbi:MAG: slipin family protein [Spirochaetaceae bacterium]|jgi:regulator of protease activity HflC (stomatin/prohibitin superfamily)|nr:slipin family protein [Spirochaetaceae bacterium]
MKKPKQPAESGKNGKNGKNWREMKGAPFWGLMGAGAGAGEKRETRRGTRDFTVCAPGVAIGAALVLTGGAALSLWGTSPRPTLASGAAILAAPFAAFLCMLLYPRWSGVLKLFMLVNGIFGFILLPAYTPAIFFASLAVLFVPSLQKVEEWERAIVLRFGRFRRVCGPGLFPLIPLADRVAEIVDLRIRVADFAAQETLTLDSVTVTVDALCFWLVWDPEKAVLEVQDYEEAVILSAKTALRNALSSHDLTTFLERRDIIEQEMRSAVDRKTTEWGITVQHVEITEVQIPEALQDSLSRLAQAEREKKSRVLLAEAEIAIARKLEEAVAVYRDNEPALKLKILSILSEGLKAGNSMMLVPNSIAEELTTKDIFGLEALRELKKTGIGPREEEG